MHDTRSLTSRLAELLRREHGALADFLLALAEFDRERLWLELGYTSCFYFLHRELGLSKSAAFYRASAAALLQRFPDVVEPLRDGRLCLSSVSELAKVITQENRGEILPRFFHASKQEAKAVVAELRPVDAPPRRDVVTAAPAPSSRAALVVCEVAPLTDACAESVRLIDIKNSVRPEEPAASVRSAPGLSPRDDVEPLTADLRRLHVTVSKRFLAKLAAARDALSHGQPDATTEAVFEAALDLLLAKADARKGLVKKPRPPPTTPSPDPRHIPAAVKRAVWLRDAGRCQWPLASGGICGSTRRLELDHILPVALGGTATTENLRVTCRGHNQLAARQTLGDSLMDRFAPAAS